MTKEKVDKILDELQEEFEKLDIPTTDKIILFGKVQNAIHISAKLKEQEPKTKIEESNFSQEQYLADIQSAYDCGKSVIDKIRAEIENINLNEVATKYEDRFYGFQQETLAIIDKYEAESEGKE